MKKTLPWLFLVMGIIISSIIWNYISLPYENSNTILGQYSEKKINPLNDTLRGLFFIFFPLFLYLIVFLKQNRDLVSKEIFQSQIISSTRKIDYLCVILIIFSILEFYNLDYKEFLGELDVHHEGTFLTAQLNFFSKNKFWTGTFFDYGFLGNSIGIFFNQIFENYSIGIQRFSFKFLILINKVLLILICRKIVNSLDLSNKKEVIFFIFSLLTLTLANFYENLTPFHNRIFIYLIFTLSIFNVVTSKKKNVLISFFIGSLSVLSILFYWDIGTYINFLLIIFLIFIFLLKKYDVFYKVILGFILTWLLFFFLVPKNEFKEFLNQYFIILNVSDYLIGLEFPNPFTNGSTRHTKALLLIVFSGVFLINFIFNKVKKESFESKIMLFFLFVSSIIFFKSGLTRSDGPHIKYTSGIYTLLIYFFISYYLINIINISKFRFILDFFLKKKYLNIFIFIIYFTFFFQNNFSNILNIFNPNKNFHKLTKLDDEKFLNKDYSDFIKVYKDLVKDELCVQQFTDDNAIAYLVNKPTCTKYYVNANILKNWTEIDFIEELIDNEPNYILYSSSINWFKSRNNAPNADKFILENYFLYKDLSPWIIYKKR
jgi:hypothetical protein